MAMRARAFGAVLLFAALLAGPAAASPRSAIVHWCPQDVPEAVARIARMRVPVGCALIDCCPNCPAATLLDWQVRLGGRFVDSLEIRFDDLPDSAQIRLDGDATRTKDGIRVGPRGATLHGLPTGGERVPFATLRLQLDEDAIAKLRDGDVAAEPDPRDTIEIAIDQMLGPVVVNEFWVRLPRDACKAVRPGACDTIVQQNNRGGDASVVLVDGRTSTSCNDDDRYRAAASADVGNILGAQSCSSEISIFSAGDAMAMHAPETAWTDACGDHVNVAMDPPIVVPVTVWIASFGASTADAQADIANANLVYDRNKTGIAFDAEYRDVPILERLRVSPWCPAARPTGYYAADRVNVYYTDDLIVPGMNCDPDRSRIYVGLRANVATLAHEFGHALSLFGAEAEWAHTDGVPNFTNENLMYAGGPPTRDHISLGQAFRFDVDARSYVNTAGLRSGPTRVCPAIGPYTAACPRLDLDWNRP